MKTASADFKVKANLPQGTTPVILAKILYGSSASVSIGASTDATPIVITTTIAHGFENGDSIIISGHTINTNANGCWIVANKTAFAFQLKGSTGTGAGAGGTTGTIVRGILCSTRKVAVSLVGGGTDIYKPYILSYGEIGYGVTEAPGLGSQPSGELILNRKIFVDGGGTENAIDNLLTQKSKGKKVQLWQFFDDTISPVLTDTHKLPLATFIIDEVSDIEGASLKLNCISPEILLGQEVPKLKFNKTTFPNLLEDNIGIIIPILFGNNKYTLSLDAKKEYLSCNQPINPPTPAYLTDIYDFKFVVHEAANPTPITPNTNLAFFEWFSEWNVYAFCIKDALQGFAPDYGYIVSASGGRIIVDMNALYGVSFTGKHRLVRIMPSEPVLAGQTDINTATDWKKAIDLDDTTVCTISANTNLIVMFDEKNALSECSTYLHEIAFNITAVTGTIRVIDGIVGGSATEQGTFSTIGFKEIEATRKWPAKNIVSSTNTSPIVITLTAHGYEDRDRIIISGHTVNTAANGNWVITNLTENTFELIGSIGNGVGGATGTAERLVGSFGKLGEIPQGYYIKIECGAGESCDINGLHLKMQFESNKKPVKTIIPGVPSIPRTVRSFLGQEFIHWSRPIAPILIPVTGINNYFYNGDGVNTVIDSQSFDYNHPVYITQYILRQILGYLSTELQYSSFASTFAWLANGSGPVTEPFVAWKFAGCLNTEKPGGDWLLDILNQCACWLYWGGESGWNLFPINYNNIVTGILTFKDTDSIRPLIDFKFYRTPYIYNRFIFNWDYDYATGSFRQQTIYDQSNKTELATSVTDYGETIYPIQDYFFIHELAQVENLYKIYKRTWKDPRWIIEFETRLSASWLEIGDNITIDHKACTGINSNSGTALNNPTGSPTGTNFQILEHRQEGNRIFIKAVEIIP